MKWIPDIFALLTAIAGWFYLFYSRAAHGLSGIEQDRANQKRIVLRRASGVTMLLLAALFYVGFHAVTPEQTPRLFVGVWLGVLGLLLIVVYLALLDVRLTVRLRQKQKRERL